MLLVVCSTKFLFHYFALAYFFLPIFEVLFVFEVVARQVPVAMATYCNLNGLQFIGGLLYGMKKNLVMLKSSFSTKFMFYFV